jgi:hypothetical protein
MRYRCPKCGHESLNPGMNTLDKRWRKGPCVKATGGCGKKEVVFILVDESQEARIEARAKETGMTRAQAVSEDWGVRADAALKELIGSGVEFTSEDVTLRAGMPPSSGAVGAKMNAAARKGQIKHVGYTKAQRARQHQAELRTWIGTNPVEEDLFG